MTKRRFPHRRLSVLDGSRSWACPLAVLCVGALTGCVSTADPWTSQLPEISSENAVTLSARSLFNPGEIQHEHVLQVDGLIAGKFKNDQVKTFQIPAGPHKLTLNCYTGVFKSGVLDKPINYTVPDGKTKMDIDPKAGDELCLKITYSLTNCAVLEDADPTYCRREPME